MIHLLSVRAAKTVTLLFCGRWLSCHWPTLSSSREWGSSPLKAVCFTDLQVGISVKIDIKNQWHPCIHITFEYKNIFKQIWLWDIIFESYLCRIHINFNIHICKCVNVVRLDNCWYWWHSFCNRHWEDSSSQSSCQSAGLQLSQGERSRWCQGVLPHCSQSVSQSVSWCVCVCVCLRVCCRWCPAPLWTSTSVRVPGWSERCSTMLGTTSHA